MEALEMALVGRESMGTSGVSMWETLQLALMRKVVLGWRKAHRPNGQMKTCRWGGSVVPLLYLLSPNSKPRAPQNAKVGKNPRQRLRLP